MDNDKIHNELNCRKCKTGKVKIVRTEKKEYTLIKVSCCSVCGFKYQVGDLNLNY